jgi:hypothetical protein
VLIMLPRWAALGASFRSWCRGRGAAVAGQAGDPGQAHQPFHGRAARGDAQAQGQLGVDAPGAVSAAGYDVNSLDLLGQCNSS